MAPYKNRRKHLHSTKKQIKIIESRLMEISLRIDNYIYKNKPILLHDAAVSIEEVSSYKYQYGKDPRIFQVAEKLIRQLKGVIEEQDTNYSWNVQEVIENSIAVCLPSPTYSERDIDVIQLKDPLCDDNEVGRNEFSKGDKADNPFTSDVSLIEPAAKANVATAIYSFEKDTHRRIDDRINRDNTTDFSHRYNVDERNIKETKAQINDCNAPIKDLQRSLSQLAIKTVNEEKQKSTSLRTVRKISHGSKYDQSLTSLEMLQKKSSYSGDYQHRDMTVTISVNKVSTDTIPIKAISNNHTTTIGKFQQVEDIIPKNVPKKGMGRKKAVTKQIELYGSPKEKPKRRRNNTTLKSKLNNDITVNGTKSVRTRCPKNNNTVVNSVVEKPPIFQSDPTRSIYNNNVENDLSWIENIRYIREAAAEEIDSKLKYHDDSFWDTFDLPANWNDQDFLY